MPKKSNQKWLSDQLDFISDLGRRAAEAGGGVSHAYGPHTALKLAALNHSLGVFLPIARKQITDYGKFDGAVYIDLFAGCGATRMPESGDWLAGSPILAAGSRYRFDRIVCMESDPENASALEARFRLFPDRVCEVMNGDCNVLAPDLKNRIGLENPLAFVFVDPQGMDLRWETLEALSGQFPCMDLLLNFPYGAERVLADLRTGRELNRQVMAAFAGTDWPMLLAADRQSVVDFVEAKISTVLGRPVGDKVLIRDLGQRPRYFLLFRVRRTLRGSPFFGAYEEMLNRVRGLSPQEVTGVLNDKFGRSVFSFGDEIEPQP